MLAATGWQAASGLAHRSAVAPAVADGLRADFNNDGFADLAVGVTFEDLGAIVDAGAVNVLFGSAAGLTGTGGQVFTQDSPGVPGVVEFDDFFGEALATSGPSSSTAASTSPMNDEDPAQDRA